MATLLATKLFQPALPPRRVRRPHLITRLNDGLAAGRQISLVSAPAGFGKTTCVSEWLHTLRGWAVTWLSLDPADDDPERFFTYLLAALHKVDGGLGREIWGALRAGQLPPAEVISAGLINDILALEGRFMLILDDLQVIQDPFTLHVLGKWVLNLPPPLYMVLITREDPALPLARLRANNQLTEVRAGDLRFSSQETGLFLDQVMGLTLSPADVAALELKTEGWIAGLQLAGLSVQSRADPSAFIAALSGSQRFILSYLTEEVLNQQPAEIQQFLLQTSVLDRLCGDLCDAVTGRADGQAMLERLFNANLFLIALDDEQQWYRYHHLFADLLRHRQNALRPEQTAALHRRASRWYAQAGSAALLHAGERRLFIGAAVEHALAAADGELAVRLVEDHAMDMIMQGHVKTVANWMQAIPLVWSAQSIRANMAFAWMHLLRGTRAQAAPYMERLQAIFGAQVQEAADPSLQAQWLALQSAALNTEGSPAASLDKTARALEIVPQHDHLALSLIYLRQADAYQLLDDYARVVDAFQMMIHHGRMAANLVIELLGLAGLSALTLRHGQLHLAFEMASRGVERIERAGMLPPTAAAIYGTLGQIYYQWNRLDQAHSLYQRAVQVSTLSGFSDVEIFYDVLRSRLHEVEGNLESAAHEIQKAVDLARAGAPAWLHAEVVRQQVRLELARDDPLAAEMALRQSGISSQDEVGYGADAIHIAYLRLMLYHVREGSSVEVSQADELAGRIVASAEAGQRIETAVQALLLWALVRAAKGETRSSLELLARALRLAEPEGYIRVFLDEGAPVAELLRQAQKDDRIAELLAFFPSPAGKEPPPRPGGGRVEPLSERELEILRLIDEGFSNQAIAARLAITLHTVKKHNSNIYAKLGVTSRTQAVAQARQLGLL